MKEEQKCCKKNKYRWELNKGWVCFECEKMGLPTKPSMRRKISDILYALLDNGEQLNRTESFKEIVQTVFDKCAKKAKFSEDYVIKTLINS